MGDEERGAGVDDHVDGEGGLIATAGSNPPGRSPSQARTLLPSEVMMISRMKHALVAGLRAFGDEWANGPARRRAQAEHEMRRRTLWADALEAMGAARTVVEVTWAKAENNEVLSDADLQAFMQALEPLPIDTAVMAVQKLMRLDYKIIKRPLIYKWAAKHGSAISRVVLDENKAA